MSIGNDAISLSKEFSGKNGSKLAWRSPTNAHADVKKMNKLTMVFRTNRRSLKYAPKEFSKINTCMWDPPWCYKNTIFQTTQISYSCQPRMIHIVSQRLCAHLIFKQLCHVTTWSWIKIFIHAGLRTGLYSRDLINELLSAPNKEINFFIFVAQLLILSFHSLTLLLYIVFKENCGKIIKWISEVMI